jgi:hypothetical protein
MNMERKEQQLKAVSNTLGEDSEGGSFAKDISSEGWIVENLVGKPVIAANTRQGEICNAEDSEESRLVSRQQVGLVEDTVDTVRMEQLLQAGSTTLLGNQGDGEMISVGSGKISLQCGDCSYHTQQVNPNKARQRLAQHRKLSHIEVVGIPVQDEGGHLSELHVQGGDFENPYLVEKTVHESHCLVEVPVYEVPYLRVVKITHQEIFMNPDLGEENMNPDLGEEIKKLDLGRIAKISNQGAVVLVISDKKFDLGVVDKIINQGAQMLDIKNKEHEFRDAGG